MCAKTAQSGKKRGLAPAVCDILKKYKIVTKWAGAHAATLIIEVYEFTEAIQDRMVWVITGVLALLVLLALPAKAESADYETTLDRLGRLHSAGGAVY